jgi:uncharacterized membrane protein
MERVENVDPKHDTETPMPLQSRERKQLLTSTALIGIGIMAAVDEIVFHQLLSWHHFYVGSSLDIALLSDGLLHAAELVAIVGGFFMFADLHDRNIKSRIVGWGGFFIGAGAFQVFDGIADHKILRLHQIRYGVENLWLYDAAWNAFGVTLLMIGLLMLRRAQHDGSHGASARTDR